MPDALWPDPFEDDYGTQFQFFLAAGSSIHDCAILGQRFDGEEGFRWDASESWLLRVRPGPTVSDPDQVRLVLGGPGWLTRLWVSPSGKFWACSMSGEVFEESGDRGYRTHRLPVALSGLWGLSETDVFAWSETAERMFRWNGAQWAEMSCPGRLIVLAGTGVNDVLAGGYDGCLWRWNGQVWAELGMGLNGTVVGLATSPAQSAYACTLAGEVAEISTYGEQLVTCWSGPLLDVTVMGRDVLLAAGSSGLLRMSLGTNILEEVPATFFPERFDQRDGQLLISAGRGVVATQDGETFSDLRDASELRDLLADQPPSW